ncbi:MAG: hypothetical protein JSR82_12165 [Verrucomicrobia bacterium]|nr:hypothetical protein [Verrucomicrobiota bacterium]
MSRPCAFLWLAALSGCTGDPVDVVRDGGAGDGGVDDSGAEVGADASDAADAPADAADALCSTVPGNLVQNPSFELAPAGVISGWLGSSVALLARRTEGAAHCTAWAEVHLAGASTSKPVYFAQDVVLDTPLVKGARIVATAYFRTLDTRTDGELVVGVVGGDYRSKLATLPLDRAWKQVTVEWTVSSAEEGQTKLYVGLTSTYLGPRAVGVDHVTLVVTPP